MANKKLVQLVNGENPAQAFAEWRTSHPRLAPNFTNAELKYLDLENADLSGANFTGATIDSPNLEGSNLSRCILHRTAIEFNPLVRSFGMLADANLAETTIHRSTFSLVDFSGAVFAGASVRQSIFDACFFYDSDFSRSNLNGVVFDGCEFQGADFTSVSMNDVRFIRSDLSRIAGLGKIQLRPDCCFDIDTLVITLRATGSIYSSEVYDFFLRARVPETLLTYLPSLIEAHPIEFQSCFISYSQPDQVFADKLYEDLVKTGIRCWKYDHDALLGRELWLSIDRAISAQERIIIVCSENSLKSPAVMREIERAIAKEDAVRSRQLARDILVPIRLDNYVLDGWDHHRKTDIVAKYIGDFRFWKDPAIYARELDRLVNALAPNTSDKLPT